VSRTRFKIIFLRHPAGCSSTVPLWACRRRRFKKPDSFKRSDLRVVFRPLTFPHMDFYSRSVLSRHMGHLLRSLLHFGTPFFLSFFSPVLLFYRWVAALKMVQPRDVLYFLMIFVQKKAWFCGDSRLPLSMNFCCSYLLPLVRLHRPLWAASPCFFLAAS